MNARSNLRALARMIGGLIVILGTSLAIGSSQARDRDPEWVAPSRARATVNPLADRSGAAAGGRKLFQQRCGTCHGGDGAGTAKAPSLSGAEVQRQTDGELYWKITTGNARARMPAFSFLPELQRWQLVLHLRQRGSQSP
jgi:mono/diheme cytochrome c family protein